MIRILIIFTGTMILNEYFEIICAIYYSTLDSN